MERLALFFVTILFALAPTPILAQNAWQDDGLIWVALTLIDQDAPGGPAPLRDAFMERCSESSPKTLADWMPNGFRQDRDRHHRELEHGVCERVIPLRVRGQIDWTPTSVLIPWQPGEGARRSVGIPREGSGRLAIRFPDVLVVGAQAYQTPEPIFVSVSDNERFTSVVVPVRRLARAIIYEPVAEVALDRHTIPYDVTTHFLLPGARIVQTDREHRLRVVAVDPRGRRHNVTQPRDPERYVALSATYGWIFEVSVLPRARTHRDWALSLRASNP